jgi:hypothetical protein
VLGGFITEDIIKDDEIMMEPLVAILNEFAGGFSPDIKALARADFERTKGVADRFLRDEVRITARLLIAQSILLPQQATQQMGPRILTTTQAPSASADSPN